MRVHPARRAHGSMPERQVAVVVDREDVGRPVSVHIAEDDDANSRIGCIEAA